MTISQINIESKILDLSEENLKQDPEARQFRKESWPVRRDLFKKHRNNELRINEISTEKWFNSILFPEITEDGEKAFPLLILIDGTFAHSAAVYFAKRYIDYKKFQSAFGEKAEKIHYFSASQEGDKITSFLNYVRSIPGCEVITKMLPKTLDQKDKKASHPAYKSVAVDMAVVSLREIYDNEAITNVLILSRDPEIIPVIRELRDLDIVVTLARSKDIPTSRLLLTECTHVVDIYELFDYMNVYSDTSVRKTEDIEEYTTIEI